MLIDALNEVSQSTEFNPSRHPDVLKLLESVRLHPTQFGLSSEESCTDRRAF